MSFLSNLEWRHATKAFDPAQSLPAGSLDKILHAIRMAPTSFGLQPFRVEVIQNPALQAELKPHAWNQAQITTAPALLVFVARLDMGTRISQYLEGISGGNADARAGLKGYEDMMRGSMAAKSPEMSKEWTIRQAYIAMGFALAACAELKIDSCAMEGMNPVEFNRILGIPKDETSAVVMAVGIRDPQAPLRAKFRFSDADLFKRR